MSAHIGRHYVKGFVEQLAFIKNFRCSDYAKFLSNIYTT